MSANDVRQGEVGDCWFISALCALSNTTDLLSKVCVARDEKVGVYGFVFYRGTFETRSLPSQLDLSNIDTDGDWKHCIVDDKLYLSQEDFKESDQQRQDWRRTNLVDAEEECESISSFFAPVPSVLGISGVLGMRDLERHTSRLSSLPGHSET